MEDIKRNKAQKNKYHMVLCVEAKRTGLSEVENGRLVPSLWGRAGWTHSSSWYKDRDG